MSCTVHRLKRLRLHSVPAATFILNSAPPRVEPNSRPEQNAKRRRNGVLPRYIAQPEEISAAVLWLARLVAPMRPGKLYRSMRRAALDLALLVPADVHVSAHARAHGYRQDAGFDIADDDTGRQGRSTFFAPWMLP